MRHGKMKTLFGLYKKLGAPGFLRVAKNYSDHVKRSVEPTLLEMEGRWYDKEHTITEAAKMVADYNKGVLVGYDIFDDAAPDPISTVMKMEELA